MAIRTGSDADTDFREALERVKDRTKGIRTHKKAKSIEQLRIDELEKAYRVLADKKTESPRFKVRLRKEHSFSYSNVEHFRVAYGLTADKNSYMTMDDFRRFVRNNAPIALSNSSGTMLIGHPYDF